MKLGRSSTSSGSRNCIRRSNLRACKPSLVLGSDFFAASLQPNFSLRDAMPESRWEDIVLHHVEPFFEGKEHQIEIVLEQENHLRLGRNPFRLEVPHAHAIVSKLLDTVER